jgi:hypothetical protein
MVSIINFVISQSIWIPIIIGLVRFKIIKSEYLPFFWLLVVGLITEFISFLLIRYASHGHSYGSNAVPTNLFVLAEWLLLAYQFHIWGFLKKRKRFYYLLISLPVFIWIVENIIFGKIDVFSPYFRILYAFLITLAGITEINYRITHDNKNLFRSPKFIICIGLILFFVYQILYEWAYQVSLIAAPTGFTTSIISLFAYIDAITNIIFGIAFLVAREEKEFKLESI